MEGGKGTTSKLIKWQVRPDPLAKWTNSDNEGDALTNPTSADLPSPQR
jgi:hypothetical protein